MSKFSQGEFIPKNPQKLVGKSVPVYRSSWELKLMLYLDEHKDVLTWGSEELSIPYRSPIDGRIHRYFPDFMVKIKNREGLVESMILEVKPAAQTQPPKSPKRRTKRYISEVMTYGVNEAKWKAAREYCKDKGWEFRIITEAELFKKPTK